MNIIKGNSRDITLIMDVIKDNIIDMESKEIYQWNSHYPEQAIFENDINNETLYLIKNDQECLGIIVFDEQQSPEYKEIDWFTEGYKVLVIHRLVVNTKYQKQGIARLLLGFAEDIAIKKGYTSIRLDAYSGNSRALKLYENRGYIKTGQIFFPYRELPFYCYEKNLKL
jgi:ribosomal protein S18 acetylase RimI-like enzyme